MHAIELAFVEMDSINKVMMEKRGRGEKLSKEDNALLKEKMKAIHLASGEVEIETIAELLDKYEIGLGMAHIEPSYERINYAFAWIEARDGDGDDDF